MKMLRQWNGDSHDLLIAMLKQFDIAADSIYLQKYEVISPDSFIWAMEVKSGEDHGSYYLYAEDYVPSLKHVRDTIAQNLAQYPGEDKFELVPAAKVLVWDQSEPVQSAEYAEQPEDADEFMKYAASSGYDFVFLAKVIES